MKKKMSIARVIHNMNPFYLLILLMMTGCVTKCPKNHFCFDLNSCSETVLKYCKEDEMFRITNICCFKK